MWRAIKAISSKVLTRDQVFFDRIDRIDRIFKPLFLILLILLILSKIETLIQVSCFPEIAYKSPALSPASARAQ